jgi:SAM-dependent methyltransferase
MSSIDGKNVLDVGSGRGDLAHAFRALGMSVEIADVNPEAAGLAGNSFVYHQIADSGQIPIDAESVDAVVLKSVIEHLHDPYPMLKEIRRVLRPGGKLILLTPSWRHNVEVFYDAPGHVQPYTLRSLRLTLEIADFEVELCSEVRQVPWTWSLVGRRVTALLTPFFPMIPRSVRRPGVRFLREVTLLAVSKKD